MTSVVDGIETPSSPAIVRALIVGLTTSVVDGFCNPSPQAIAVGGWVGAAVATDLLASVQMNL